MRFLVDAQLPPSLAQWLSGRGHDARHVCEFMPPSTPDWDIWAWASTNKAVLVSKDHDFVPIARSRRTAQLLWIRLGNTTNAALVAALEAQWPVLEAGLLAGNAVVQLTEAP